MAQSNIDFRRIFLEWEKLRIVYLAALTLVVAAAIGFDSRVISERGFARTLILGFIGANVVFCCGPVLDAYVTFLADRRIHLKWFLFIPGLLFAILLAAWAILWLRMRHF